MNFLLPRHEGEEILIARWTQVIICIQIGSQFNMSIKSSSLLAPITVYENISNKYWNWIKIKAKRERVCDATL